MEPNSKLIKFLRYGIYSTAFIALVIVNEFISPFHFTKVLVFRSIIEVLAVFYILLILKDKSFLPKKNKIFYSFLFFTLAFTLTTLTSTTKYLSFWGSLERMGGLWSFWHYFIFFIIMTSVLRTKREWMNLFNLTIISGILSAIYGFGQKTDIDFFIGSGGRERIFGTIGNAALFAGYQIITSFLALTLFFKKDNNKAEKIFYGAGFLIIIISSLMTAVRGSVLGIVIGLLVFGYLLAKISASRLAKKIFKYFALAVLVVIVFLLSMRSTSFYLSLYLRRKQTPAR